MIAVGEGSHVKHWFQRGMEFAGSSVPAEDPRKETAVLYKTSGFHVVKNAEA